jgi:hypothetical protein
MTVSRQGFLSTAEASASVPIQHRSRPVSDRSGKSDGSSWAGLPSSCRRYGGDCCRQSAKRGRASSARAASAHRSTPHPRSPLPARRAGLCCRDVAALTSGGSRANDEHRWSAWCLRTAAHPAIGVDTSRCRSLEWGTEPKCPVSR